MLKFDFFFFFGFIIQLWVNGKVKDYVLTIGSMPATFVILIASTWFMRRENRAAMIVVLVSYSIGCSGTSCLTKVPDLSRRTPRILYL